MKLTRQGHLLAPVVRAVALADLRVVLLVGLALREQVRDHLDVAAAHLEGAHAAGGVAAHDPGDAGALRDQAAAGVDLVVDREGGVGHRGGRVGGANGSRGRGQEGEDRDQEASHGRFGVRDFGWAEASMLGVG